MTQPSEEPALADAEAPTRMFTILVGMGITAIGAGLGFFEGANVHQFMAVRALVGGAGAAAFCYGLWTIASGVIDRTRIYRDRIELRRVLRSRVLRPDDVARIEPAQAIGAFEMVRVVPRDASAPKAIAPRVALSGTAFERFLVR